VDGVGPGERPGRVRQLRHALDVRERPDGVRRDREGDDARAAAQLPLEVVEIERRVVVDVREDDPEVLVVRELEPRRHVPVVVELRDDDLVACLPVARSGAGEREVQRRHVRAEDRLLGPAAKEVGGGQARLRDERFRAPAGLVRPADVGVGVAVIGGDSVDDRVGHLSPAGPVEEGEGLAERGETCADCLDVERHG